MSCKIVSPEDWPGPGDRRSTVPAPILRYLSNRHRKPGISAVPGSCIRARETLTVIAAASRFHRGKNCAAARSKIPAGIQAARASPRTGLVAGSDQPAGSAATVSGVLAVEPPASRPEARFDPRELTGADPARSATGPCCGTVTPPAPSSTTPDRPDGHPPPLAKSETPPLDPGPADQVVLPAPVDGQNDVQLAGITLPKAVDVHHGTSCRNGFGSESADPGSTHVTISVDAKKRMLTVIEANA